MGRREDWEGGRIGGSEDGRERGWKGGRMEGREEGRMGGRDVFFYKKLV